MGSRAESLVFNCIRGIEITKLTCMFYSTEPHQGDGRLLRGSYETLRRPEDGAAHPQRARLHRLHAHSLPELSSHVTPARY